MRLHMQIAYIRTEEQGHADALLTQAADRLLGKGMRVQGIVQINTHRPDCHKCDMDVRVLPDGPVIRISQSLGPEARGCRLDTAALEGAIHEVRRRVGDGAEVLILNKFGKHEAEGRGFRDLIAQALMNGIPVITAVSSLNLEAFLKFTDGFAVQIDAVEGAVCAWAIAQGQLCKA
jgi:nucleoside-triphosphatase THEP1